MKSLLLATSALFLLGACEHIPGAAYHQVGTPESLLDASSERVSIDLSGNNGNAIQELTYWLNQEQPSRAELHCVDGDMICTAASGVLQQFNVPTQRQADGAVVHLIYERVVARDCDNRYIDNPHNPYNLHHPTFGCSLAANSVQMVTDKREFTSPGLTDEFDGRRAYQIMQGAAQPNRYGAPVINTTFPPLTGGTVSQGGSR